MNAPWRIFELQNRPKPFRCQPITVAGLMMETRASQPFQMEESHAQRKRSAGLNFGALDRALEHAELMTQGQDLQLEGRTAPKRGAEGG